MINIQAEACASLDSPLYAALLRRAAQDVLDGGPCAAAIAGHEDAPGPDAIALRLMGAVHALVLTGRADALAAYYPSVGGSFDPQHPEAPWPAFRATVAAELPWVQDWMTRPPQTNEVGRANLLITGLLRAAAEYPLPVRLFELGSSAGLNLRADAFRCTATGLDVGPADSPVRLTDAWRDGAPGWLTSAAAEHPRLTVTERHGCDLTPIDPLSPEGALALRAYIWADQAARAARLDGALEVAAKLPATVAEVGAADFLREVHVVPGALTVVWHSIMRQYVPTEEWALVEVELDRLRAESAESSAQAPFAHLAFEPHRAGDQQQYRFQLVARLGAGAPLVLAEAHPHGLPAWE
ncbi:MULTISPECIES: DUF2332 domain-containing protein [unclassified Kitasatospora]|uniref:DUF2332 domain-containing protein n=1 Tax=unclassified Kitasatospora TaxID=2633591 RepID=UPI0024750249|nr:DUF2332 domain-containing protein [Kitasatospora sp. MAP12-44]